MKNLIAIMIAVSLTLTFTPVQARGSSHHSRSSSSGSHHRSSGSHSGSHHKR